MEEPRLEYPRPHFVRQEWQPLNGIWTFDYDDHDEGLRNNYHLPDHKFGKSIYVPFSPQSKKGGINDLDMHDIMWYQRKFVLKEGLLSQNILLCFNAVDNKATVWVNGKFAYYHVNGYSAFSFDISPFLIEGENTITVRVKDGYDVTQPRGKQFWKFKPEECWYTATSGIWQSVWLEKINKDYLVNVSMTPDIDDNSILFELETLGMVDKAELDIHYKDKPVKKIRFSLDGRFSKQTVNLLEENSVYDVHLWSIDKPNLYDVRISLFHGDCLLDEVDTYFGMRKVSLGEDGSICLNNTPVYQRLVLDQGYFEEGDLTPLSVDELKQDILLSKEMGFNGARKHQKIEDPYYYHYADKLGFLVWAEMPSAYKYNQESVRNVFSQYIGIVRQLYNHPSIICWVPVNESWGARKALIDKAQISFIKSLYFLSKSLDQTRLVSANDGWENITETDFISIHDYSFTAEVFQDKYALDRIQNLYPMSRKLIAYGEKYTGQAVMLTEFGGFAIKEMIPAELYAYGGVAKTDFVNHLKEYVRNIRKCPFSGYVYTQLSDTKQEANGLLDARRRPKVDINLLKEVFGK